MRMQIALGHSKRMIPSATAKRELPETCAHKTHP